MKRKERPGMLDDYMTGIKDVPRGVPQTRAPLPAPPVTPARRTTVYLPEPVYHQLRDLAHEERKSMTNLVLEGLDHVFSTRGFPTTGELKGR